MLGNILLIVIVVLFVTLCAIIAEIYVERVRSKYEDEIDQIKEDAAAELEQWTIWLYDPERRFSERKREMEAYRLQVTREWKRNGVTDEEAKAEALILDGFIGHYLASYYRDLFGDGGYADGLGKESAGNAAAKR